MLTDGKESPWSVVKLGMFLAHAMSPDERWYITDWCQPFEGKPLRMVLKDLRSALERACGDVPEFYDQLTRRMAEAWDEVVREQCLQVPLLLLALRFALWADANDEDERGGYRPVRLARFLACVAWAKVSAVRGIVQTDFRGYLDKGWCIDRRIEELCPQVLGELVADRVVSVVGTGGGEEATLLCAEATDVIARVDQRAIIRGDLYSELKRLDPLQNLIDELADQVWRWCWARLDGGGRALLGTSVYLTFLTFPACLVPDSPGILFDLDVDDCGDLPGEFARYAHCVHRVEYYWQSANAAGWLPMLRLPAGLGWDTARSVHECRAVAEKQRAWANREVSSLERHLYMPHIPSADRIMPDGPSVARRQQGCRHKLEKARRKKVVVVDTVDRAVYVLGLNINLNGTDYEYVRAWAERPNDWVENATVVRRLEVSVRRGAQRAAKSKSRITKAFGGACMRFKRMASYGNPPCDVGLAKGWEDPERFATALLPRGSQDAYMLCLGQDHVAIVSE